MPTVSVAQCWWVSMPLPRAFDADELDGLIVDKAGKDADGVGAAADTGA